MQVARVSAWGSGLAGSRAIRQIGRMPVVRRAQSSDAAALSRLAEQTFRETFGAQNTVSDMELHCRETYSPAIQAREIADPARATLVSVEGEELIGLAQMRWPHAPAGVTAKNPGEIQRLYVAQGWHGRGVAHELMHACLEELAGRGCDVAWLGVWERNPRAISFYRKFGFVEVGEHVFTLGNDPQRDLVLARSLEDRR